MWRDRLAIVGLWGQGDEEHTLPVECSTLKYRRSLHPCIYRSSYVHKMRGWNRVVSLSSFCTWSRCWMMKPLVVVGVWHNFFTWCMCYVYSHIRSNLLLPHTCMHHCLCCRRWHAPRNMVATCWTCSIRILRDGHTLSRYPHKRLVFLFVCMDN